MQNVEYKLIMSLQKAAISKNNKLLFSFYLVSILISCNGVGQKETSTKEVITSSSDTKHQETKPTSGDSTLAIRFIIDGYGSYPNSILLRDSFLYVKVLSGRKNDDIYLQAKDYSNPKMQLSEERHNEYVLNSVVAGGEIEFVITYKGLNASEDYTILHRVKVLSD